MLRDVDRTLRNAVQLSGPGGGSIRILRRA